jgi:predicted TIM-barrel fold metal-dependent hydrolase
MKIDCHSHFFPKAYFKELEKENITFGMGGIKFSILPQMHDPEVRFKDMELYGVDMQVLSIGPPGIDLDGTTPDMTVSLAKIVNDELAKLTEKYPDKFAAMACLPLKRPEQAVKELERAVNELKLKGAKIFSNVDGKPLDGPEFIPLFAKAAELDVPLFIHPTTPRAREGLQEYGLTIIVGLLFDSTLAVSRLIFSGLLDKYPNLKIILAHLGSTLPYILARLDSESATLKNFIPGYELPISRAPSEYFKLIYMDTVSHHRPAYICAHATSGPEKIMLGSDYPYSRWKETVKAIEELDIPDGDKEKIYAGNVKKLLKLT